MTLGPSSPRDLETLTAALMTHTEEEEKSSKSSEWYPPALDRAELYDERRLEQVFCEKLSECNPERPTHRHLTENCQKHKFCVVDEIPLKEPKEMEIL